MQKRILAHLLAADGAIPNHPRWPPYHSNAHEALGICSGEVTVQFGGDHGVIVVGRPGDVVVIPAGTGRKKLSSRGSFGIVGAYPADARPETCMPPFARAKKNAEAAAQVPPPGADAVFGAHGPLFEHWR